MTISHMIQLQLLYSDQKKETISMKTSWNEVTYNDLTIIHDNKKLSEYERLQANIASLCGSSLSTIQQINSQTILSLIPFLRFIDETDHILYEPIGEEIKSINIALMPWGLLEEAKSIFTNYYKDNIVKAHIGIVEVYTRGTKIKGLDISNMSITKATPIVNYIEGQLFSFLDKYKELSDFKPTQKQYEAGIDELKDFGFYATLYQLASGDRLKFDSFLNLSAEDIYFHLLYDLKHSKYLEKLNT